MGWLFGHYDRRSLINHLCDGNGVKTIKRCFRGNNMWAVQEYVRKDGEVIRFACLYLLRGNPRVKNDPYNWGYKDVDETMGPNQTDFPVSWLDLLSPTDSQYALDWRKSVRERGEKSSRFTIGTKWKCFGHIFEITKRRSPSAFYVKNEYGELYRLNLRHLLSAEAV